MTAFTCNTPGSVGAAGQGAPISWKSTDHGNSTSPRFLHAWSADASADAVENVSEIVLSLPGTISNLYVRSAGITPAAVYTLRVNGIDTAITVTLSTGQTSGSDTTHTVAVVAGDALSLKVETATADANVVYPSAIAAYKQS